MRIAIGVGMLLSIVSAASAQNPAEPPNNAFRLHKLTIVAGNLPSTQVRQIAASLEGGTYPAEELRERVEQKLRDQGYYKAAVEAPRVSVLRQTNGVSDADVAIDAEPGKQYTLGEITFQGATVFPPDELRRQFSIAAGSLFNATAIGKGLDQLRNLYASRGFPEFGAIPKPLIDEATHTVSLSIDINEGRR